MVSQVAPAGAGCPPRAQGVGAQGRTELRHVVRRRDVAAGRGTPELRVALEDLAGGDGYGEEQTRHHVGTLLYRPLWVRDAGRPHLDGATYNPRPLISEGPRNLPYLTFQNLLHSLL